MDTGFAELFLSALNAINRGEWERVDQLMAVMATAPDPAHDFGISFLQAERFRHQGDLKNALLGYQKLLNSIPAAAQGSKETASLHLHCATCHLGLGELHYARQELDKAKRHANGSLDPHSEAKLSSTEGKVLMFERKYSEACNAFEESFTRHESLKDFRNAALDLLAHGHAKFALRDLSSAEQLYDKAASLSDSCSNPRVVGMALASLSRLYLIEITDCDQQMRSDIDRKSLETFADALELLAATDTRELAMAVSYRTSGHRRRGKNEAAIIAEAGQVCEERGLQQLLGPISQIVSEVFSSTEECDLGRLHEYQCAIEKALRDE